MEPGWHAPPNDRWPPRQSHDPFAMSKHAPRQPGPWLAYPARPVNAFFSTTLAVLAAAALAKLLESALALPNASILFLAAILFSSVTWGLWPSIYASVLSVLIYDLLFVEPLYTFQIASPQDILDLVIFLIVAVLTSYLAARVQSHAEAARQREVRAATLYALSSEIAGAAGLPQVLQAIVNQVAPILGARVAILLPEDDELVVKASNPRALDFPQAERAAATTLWREKATPPVSAPNGAGPGWIYLPLRTTRGVIGVLAMQLADELTLAPEQQRLVEALADQGAVAIERTRLAEEMERAQLLTETERLRAALLSSISHDLRTPLASIMGAVTSLLGDHANLNAPARQDLLLVIREEAGRLNRFVSNLLDMTRLESGALELHRDWIDIRDLAGSALARMRDQLREHRLVIQIAPDLPLAWLDFVLAEQVLVNLLDNAAKYAPPGTAIRIDAYCAARSLVLEITDQGPGVAPEDLERIFDKFYRVRKGDRQSAGTGLGLSICRGIVEAHGGRIVAARAPNGTGTTFRVTFPLEKAPPVVSEGS